MDRLGRERLLVVVAHQDDETIVAGGAMQQACRAGGIIQVIYTTDGGAAQPAGSLQRAELVQRRRREALTALALAGVTEPHVHFLDCESGSTFLRPESVAQLGGKLGRVILDFQPDKILLGAFEGGNLEHDITNFLVARAAARVGFPSPQIWEAPEYNRFHLRDPVYQRLHRIFRFGFAWPPRFPRGGSLGEALSMTAEEIAIKQRMLECFESQRHVGLVERFGFPDRFRPLPLHDYLAGPFNPRHSRRFWLNQLLTGATAFPYAEPGFGPQEYQELFQALELALVGCR
jgi:LmbE family N-acetylglucosaminyl deacetylase